MSNSQEEINAGKNLVNDKQSITESIYNTLSKLLEENVFACDYCQQFLKPPVCYVANVGTVCKTCADDNNWTRDGVNPLEKFDAVLRTIPVVSCTTEECRMPVLDGDLEGHLQQHCRYRPVDCLAEECPWRGPLADLVGHFEAEHQEDVIENEPFTFDVNVAATSFVVAKLLIRESDKFFAVLKREEESEEDIVYNMYCATFERNNVGNVSIKHVGDEKPTFRLDVEMASLNMIDDEQMTAGTKINVAALNSILGRGKTKTLEIELPGGSSAPLLEPIRCSGCRETIKPPIYACEGGHSICMECSRKSLVCLICDRNVNTKIKNRSLGAFTSDVNPCVNQTRGCEAWFPKAHLADHEAKCSYTIYACPCYCDGSRCDYKGGYFNFIEHVQQKHGTIMHANEHFGYVFKSNKDFYTKVHLFKDGNIFEISFKYNTFMNSVFNISNLMPVDRYFNLRCYVSIHDAKTSREMRITLLITKDTLPVRAILPTKMLEKGQYFDGEIDLIFSVVFET